MQRASFARWPCSVARALDLVGDAWTPLVLREICYGVHRFDDLHRGLGIARTTLTDRLGRLVDHGLVVREPYQSEPVRHEYRLTEMGRDFFPVMLAMAQWGDRWLADEAGPPIVFRHRTCGHDARPQVTCSSCGDALTLDGTTVEMGPGFPASLVGRPDVVRRFGDR